MHGRETLSALFPDEATAERAMERLRALGVPEDTMELHPASEGDAVPGAPATGILGLGGLLTPSALAEAPRPGMVMVVAVSVPGEIVTEAKRVLGVEGSEVEAVADPAPAEPDERWDG